MLSAHDILNRVADEVNPDAMRRGAVVEVNRHCLRDLLLQIAQVLPLSSDTARSLGVVPPGNQA